MKILILGVGFGGFYTLKYLHKFFHKNKILKNLKRINKSVKFVLVNKKNYFLFTPLLHEFVTGSVSLEDFIEPLRRVIRCCNYEFLQGEIKSIDLENQLIELDESKIGYDYLVIALGSKTNFYDIPGAEENIFILKYLDDAIKLRNHFVHTFEIANRYLFLNQHKNILNTQPPTIEVEGILNFVVVGGRPTGVELVAEMSDYFYKTFFKIYPKELISKLKIILIEKGNEIIPQFSKKLKKITLEVLKNKKIEIILGRGVKKVDKNFIILDYETLIKTKTVIWTAGIRPNLLEIVGNIEKESTGRVIVSEYLQLKNYNNVFSLGDICCFIQNQKPLPRLAQVTVRQAEIVAKNIFYSIYNKPLEKFVYKHKGDLISLGKFFAAGDIKSFIFSGFLIWILLRMAYLSKMISNRNKIKIFINLILFFFYNRDIKEL